MGKINKNISIIILVIVMIGTVSFLAPSSYAENTTNKNTTSKNTTAKNTVSTEKKEDSAKAKKNAELKMLGIRPHDFKGFKPWIYSYEVTVPEEVEEVEVYADAQHSKAKIKGLGNQKLEKGKNELKVVVTSEDGTMAETYIINVTREETTENSENVEDVENTEIKDSINAKGLANLEIVNAELSPLFETDIYEYTVNYVGDNVKMNIQAKATDDSYNIDIVGNENLKEGENLINILVTDEEGKNVATYQIVFNKSLERKEDIQQKEEEIVLKEEQKKQIILWTAVGVVSIIVIVIIIVVRNRHKRFAEEYSIPYANINNKLDDEEDYKYEAKLSEINDPKEKAKKEYLEKFGANQEDIENDIKEEIQERIEKKKKGKHKGKRFK